MIAGGGAGRAGVLEAGVAAGAVWASATGLAGAVAVGGLSAAGALAGGVVGAGFAVTGAGAVVAGAGWTAGVATGGAGTAAGSTGGGAVTEGAVVVVGGGPAGIISFMGAALAAWTMARLNKVATEARVGLRMVPPACLLWVFAAMLAGFGSEEGELFPYRSGVNSSQDHQRRPKSSIGDGCMWLLRIKTEIEIRCN